MSQLQDLMQGRWHDALVRLGINEKLLDGNGRPCPVCGGTDRFQFSDKGRGMWYCRGCNGGGDGVRLALKFTGWEFVQLAKELEKMVGDIPRTAPLDNVERKRQHAARLWSESYAGGFVVERYLRRRGFTLPIPICLREHSHLDYTEKITGHWVTLGQHPAMMAQILAPDGKHAIGLHRTYLSADGTKASVAQPKKTLGEAAHGSAIHLYRVDRDSGATARLGVAEGIETALAARQLFDLPTWATVSAQGMEELEVPGWIKEVWIFADHDRSRTGLKAASALAFRLIQKHHDVRILMPTTVGGDFADIMEGKIPNETYSL